MEYDSMRQGAGQPTVEHLQRLLETCISPLGLGLFLGVALLLVVLLKFAQLRFVTLVLNGSCPCLSRSIPLCPAARVVGQRRIGRVDLAMYASYLTAGLPTVNLVY